LFVTRNGLARVDTRARNGLSRVDTRARNVEFSYIQV